MSGILIFLIVAGAIALVATFILIGIYNQLVTLRNAFENAFSQIEVQLKRRHDLIPNLIETVKGYMKHEQETLDAVVKARQQAVSGLQAAKGDPGNAAAISQLAGAEGLLGGSLGRLFALAESYPDLKANQNMLQLQEELSDTEDKVALSRQAFNDAVTAYNTYKQTFPPVVFAAMFGHAKDASLLEFDSEAIQDAPKVEF
mgnify:CR=1 FL=1